MMQALIEWIRDRVFPDRNKPDPVLGQTGVRVRPMAERPKRPVDQESSEEIVAKRKPDLRFEAEITGRIEDAGPGKNVLVKNKYLREDTGTHDTLKIIDENDVEEDDGGIDPYNTGQFDRSKNWNSRFRK